MSDTLSTKILVGTLVSLLLLVPAVAADEAGIGDATNALCKLVNLGRQIALYLALAAMTWIGIQYITAGDNPSQRNKLKGQASMVIIGLLVILAAPAVIALLFSGFQGCPV